MKKHIFILIILVLTSCNNFSPSSSSKLRVVTSTTFVGNVVQEIAGDLIYISILFPPGTDPHTFEPRPQDIVALQEADLIFINGFGLEETLEPVLKANTSGPIVEVSNGVEVLMLRDQSVGETGDHHDGVDPHTWTDPNNVIFWVNNIQTSLSDVDPDNASRYQENAQEYILKLQELDNWIRSQVDEVPMDHRDIVTDHLIFGYFSEEYRFRQVASLVGSFSTDAEASAQDIAKIEDLILSQGLDVIFVGMNLGSSLAEQIAYDTGINIIRLYTGSLSEPGNGADSYLDYMRYNVDAIVAALK